MRLSAMSPSHNDKGRGQCPFASIDNSTFGQFQTQARAVITGDASPDTVITQAEINRSNGAFHLWSQKVPIAGLAEYVKQRCEQGAFSINSLMTESPVMAPVMDFSPSRPSYQTVAERAVAINRPTFTCSEVADFLDVIKRDPTIPLSFQLLQGFIADYIETISSEQTCAEDAEVFKNLETHYRLAANFQRVIPISIYVTGSPEERATFTSANLNAASAKRGLDFLSTCDNFSVNVGRENPDIVMHYPEIQRVFRCPAEPFLMKLLGTTDVLETVVTSVKQWREKTRTPKLILLARQGPEDEDIVKDAPNAIKLVCDFIQDHVDKLAVAPSYRDPDSWRAFPESPENTQFVADWTQELMFKLQLDMIGARNQGNHLENHPS